jgi:hypothetical protein
MPSTETMEARLREAWHRMRHRHAAAFLGALVGAVLTGLM